jgi:hypothetical protein
MRGKDRHTDQKGLRSLRPGQTTWFWRGKKPQHVEDRQSRVYFVDRGRVYAWAKYEGYEDKSGPNLQGEHQSGGAIGIRGPVRFLRSPVSVSPRDLRGQWRWRYVTPALAPRLRPVGQ